MFEIRSKKFLAHIKNSSYRDVYRFFVSEMQAEVQKFKKVDDPVKISKDADDDATICSDMRDYLFKNLSLYCH